MVICDAKISVLSIDFDVFFSAGINFMWIVRVSGLGHVFGVALFELSRLINEVEHYFLWRPIESWPISAESGRHFFDGDWGFCWELQHSITP